MKKKALKAIIFLLLGSLLAACASNETAEPAPPAEPEATLRPTAVSPDPTATALPTQQPPPPAPNTKADADVLFVQATETAVGLWTFSVEVAHPDTGWEDYADGWDVVLPDGTVAKVNPDDPFTRLLLHPHENEQPFTRSQSNIPLSPDVSSVRVRAHDLVDGFGGQAVMVDLTAASGPGFAVTRLEQ